MSLHASRPTALLTLLMLLAALASSVSAQEDQDNDAVTEWQWLYDKSATQIGGLTNGGYRIVDIEVESASPLRFSAAFVRNTGSYQKNWTWYYGLTLAQVGTQITADDGRLIDIEPYEVDGTIRYAIVMIENTGADEKVWWYYVKPTIAGISNELAAHDARLVDIEEDTLLGQTQYTAIMVRNTGADEKNWSWWVGVSQGFLFDQIVDHDLRLIDIERRSNGTYAAILEENPQNEYWWWYTNLTESELSAATAQTGSRIQNLRRVDSGGTPRFDALLNNNSNALTTRVAAILRNGSNGVSGLYLRELNGAERAGLQESFVFEPASTIKTLMHAHAMRQVLEGNAILPEPITVWTGSPDSCPQYTNPTGSSLSLSLYMMMFESDNNHTAAVRDRFGGNPVFNTTAGNFGMGNTQIVHALGCGGPPSNSMTLVDGVTLHQEIANGWLGDEREAFYSLMRNDAGAYGGGRLGTIIAQEGAALGLSPYLVDSFASHVEMAYKGGNYGYGNPLRFYYSVLAYTKLPFLSGGSLAPKEFASGVFVHEAPSEAGLGSTIDEASAELLRDEIRAALQTWADVGSGWTNLGGGAPGTNIMSLVADGTLVSGTDFTTSLTGALPSTVCTLVIGFTHLDAPFKGGIWGPSFDILNAGVPTSATGRVDIGGTWPEGVPSGFEVYVQYWQADPGAAAGFAGSNTLRGTTP